MSGIADALLLLSWSVVNPLNIEWLKGDPAAHYLGWAFYRNEPLWWFPLTWTTRLGYPVGVSIAFQDSIPFVAVPMRLLSWALPEPLQYLGLYAALALVLQMYFGLLLGRRLCESNPLFTYAAGLLSLLAPVVTLRFYGHFALASHWVLLASFLAYFRVAPGRPMASMFMPFVALLAVVGALHPYLAIQCLLIALAACARAIILDRARWRQAVAMCALLLATLAASLIVFGFFAGLEGSSYRSGEYGRFSLNLIGPISTTGLTFLLPELPLAHHFQRFEGYSYLGAGVIALLLLNIVVQRQRILTLLHRANLPLAVLAAVCTLLAATSTITVGPYTPVSVRLPGFLDTLGATFRSSGRFFWPVYYLIVLTGLTALYRLWKPRAREICLISICLLQLADVRPLHAFVRTHLERIPDHPLHSRQWQELGRDHKRLLVIPPWICPDSPGGEDSYRFFGLLAARQRMETNIYYPARVHRHAAHDHCHSIPRRIMAGLLDPSAAYVVNEHVLSALRAQGEGTHRCERIDGFNLCTRVADASARPPNLPVYRLGEVIDFAATGNANPYLLYGWSSPEPSGTWTEGPEASLVMILPPRSAGSLQLVASVTPFLARRHRRLQVDVVANDRTVGTWQFARRARAMTERVHLDGVESDGTSPLMLRFRVRNPRSPASLKLSDDPRPLGLFFRSMSIASDSEP